MILLRWVPGPRASAAWACGLACAWLAAGCAQGDKTLEEVDPASLPQTVTWEQHIDPLLDRYCASCHSDEASVGRLEGYEYGLFEGSVCGYEGVEETLFEEGNMPPGGAPRPDGRQMALLRRWASQGFPQRLDANGQAVRPGAIDCSLYEGDDDEREDD